MKSTCNNKIREEIDEKVMAKIKDELETFKKLVDSNKRTEEAFSPYPPGCHDPFCPCHKYPRSLPDSPSQLCALLKPLFMVIPPGGMHLDCPVHGSHFIASSAIWC